ncbi:hypothetical protein ABE82_26590 (plasmid) [Paenibacillus peoriae]|uniref:hypothetical protein n=1 Tax=Paenibacillus peoriae TaxID=59893 RepID=UPI000722E55C|nr:hypothetical protein [Paenibacillus peoriae]ALS09981.1 hypothetical protein ABE82_26590 [Paenibacillus peoriae]
MILLQPSNYGYTHTDRGPADYVIEDCKESFCIHRVVTASERYFYSLDQLIITPEGKYLVPNIGKGETFEEAQKIVLSFWKTVTKGSKRLGIYSEG